MFQTKKQLRQRLNEAEDICYRVSNQLASKVTQFPLNINETVYELKFRDKEGRYTANIAKANISKTKIKEVIVTEQNYFSLVHKLNTTVFIQIEQAENKINSLLSASCT